MPSARPVHDAKSQAADAGHGGDPARHTKVSLSLQGRSVRQKSARAYDLEEKWYLANPRAQNAKQLWERAFNSAHAETEQQRRTTQRVFEE
jgi:hypothetical protein